MAPKLVVTVVEKPAVEAEKLMVEAANLIILAFERAAVTAKLMVEGWSWNWWCTKWPHSRRDW